MIYSDSDQSEISNHQSLIFWFTRINVNIELADVCLNNINIVTSSISAIQEVFLFN
jgi:hypothetical protein